MTRVFEGGGCRFEVAGQRVAIVMPAARAVSRMITTADLERSELVKEVSTLNTTISYFDKPSSGKAYVYGDCRGPLFVWGGEQVFRILSGNEVTLSDYKAETLIRDHKVGVLTRQVSTLEDFVFVDPTITER